MKIIRGPMTGRLDFITQLKDLSVRMGHGNESKLFHRLRIPMSRQIIHIDTQIKASY